MQMSSWTRVGGLALMLGALIFSMTKARGYVDPDDSLLVYFMLVGFAAWLVGLAALYVRYAPISGRLGNTGLGISFVGIVMLAVGHLFSFMSLAVGVDLFLMVVLGALALTTGALLFGVAAVLRGMLPRYWGFVPLLTGLAGFAWFFLSGAGDGPLFFLVPRTLFALGWLLTGYVLFSDRRETAQDAVLTVQEVKS